MRSSKAMALAQIFALICSVSGAAQKLDEKADERDRRVVKILRTTNKAQVNQFVPVTFDLKNVDPYAVVRFFRRPIEAEEGNWWTFVHPDGNKGRLLMNVPIWQVDSIRELIATIDRPNLNSSSGDTRIYFNLQHRDPSDPGFLSALKANLTATGLLIPDVPTGSVYIEDAASGADAAVAELKKNIDVPTRQILVRAKIYEIDLNNDGTIGFDYHAWKNGPGRNAFAVGYFSSDFHTDARKNGPLAFNPGVDAQGLPGRRIESSGWNTAYSFDVPSAYFDYLVTKGKARVLTAPRATVRNTETATFFTGEQIPFLRVRDGAAPEAGVRPKNKSLDPNGDSANYPDNRTVAGDTTPRAVLDVAKTGVGLTVKPVIAEESINLSVGVSVVSQLGFDDHGAPMLATRRINTDIRTAPGAEHILGGMTRTRAIQSSRKISVLGSIPVLGWLFGAENTDAKKTMLVMALTAEPVNDFSGAGEEEKSVIEQVKESGMEKPATPKAPYGFDMMLMNSQAE